MSKLKCVTILILIIGIIILCYRLYTTNRINTLVTSHQAPNVKHENTLDPNNSNYITTAVQQLMIGKVSNSYDNALTTLKAIKAAGYDGIELNDFMTSETSIIVKLLTQFSGMSIGNSGKHDWAKLTQESGLKVISLHTNLGRIESDLDGLVEEANRYGTDTVVITGMYRFDYSDRSAVEDLASRLNLAGEKLANQGIRLLYHNHNVELQKVGDGITALDVLIDQTDADYVNFEFDSYWMIDGGANVAAIMEKMGTRLKLWHVTDRGNTSAGPYTTPIIKEDATELGSGNIDFDMLSRIAIEHGIEAVVLETHKNWVDNDPIKSIEVSSHYLHKTFHSKDLIH